MNLFYTLNSPHSKKTRFFWLLIRESGSMLSSALIPERRAKSCPRAGKSRQFATSFGIVISQTKGRLIGHGKGNAQ
jgi:hypothetical protein